MDGLAHPQLDVVGAADLDGLGAHPQRLGGTVADVEVVALGLLEEEVGDVGAEVGEAPGDVGVVADDHAGHAGEGEARGVEGAVGRGLAAVQAHLHPDAGLADAQVRVVGEQRLAGGAVLAVDDPRVAADAAPLADQLGHRCDPVLHALECLHDATGVRRTAGVAGRVGRGVLLEDAVDDTAAGDDRRVRLGVVGRPELGDLGLAVVEGEQHPVDLGLHVAAQVPRHRLEPGERVDRLPLLGRVVEAGQAQDAVLRRELGGRAVLDVGVHPLGVRRQRGARRRLQQRPLLLRDPAPAHGADEAVGLQGVLAEDLREPAGRDVAAEVHLEEALLRVDEALGAHQVVVGVGVDLRDAVRVAHDLHRGGQPRDLELALGLRQRTAYDADDRRGQHEQHQDQADRGPCRPTHGPRRAAEGLPPAGPGPVGGLVGGRGRGGG